MSLSIATADKQSRRLTMALSLTMLGIVTWSLHTYTCGFEVWTFEGRRQVLLQAGALQASAVTLRDARNKVPTLWQDADKRPAAYLVDFIYTRCPSVCRSLGSEYQQMQSELSELPPDTKGLGQVHLVSISFDVEHDTPARLAQFSAALRADPTRWTVAVPVNAYEAKLLLKSLGVVVIPDGQGGFVHNGSIHLLDQRGRLRGLYEFDQWQQALAAAQRFVSSQSQVLP
jgi:protein SCO1